MAIRGDSAGREAAYLLDMLPARPGRVLEIGCGDGRLTRKYAVRAAQIVGIDLLDELSPADFADIPRGQCLAASALRLPFRDCAFDGAIFALSF